MNGAPPLLPATTRRIRKPSAAEVSSRTLYALLCLAANFGVLAMCAKMGALRTPDLVVTLLTMACAFSLAMRDSKKLGPFLLGVWIFSRLVRRLIDWRLGGFESLTVLSLLPVMATMVLVIPTVPRLKRLTPQLRQALLLITLPMGGAAIMGFGARGAAAIIDAGNWLLPILFVPYYATRACDAREVVSNRRLIIWMAAVSAVYGWMQFLVLPPWDKLWLVESGMTSSMGQPAPLKVRVWGPMNSTGPAASVWATALVLAIADRKWGGSRRWVAVMLLGTTLLLTRVRICWLSTVAALLYWSMSQRKGGAAAAMSIVLAVVALVALAPLLPGGEMISDRLASFGNLSQDQSFRTRQDFLGDVIEMVASNPFGVGFGETSEGKVQAGQQGLQAFDNGVGQVLYTLGLPGSMIWAVGMAMLFGYLKTTSTRAGETERAELTTARALLVMSLLVLIAAYGLAGLSGVVVWYFVGLALAPSTADEGRFAITRQTLPTT